MEINPKTLENYARTAFNFGVPRDQLENFIKGSYIALPWQLKFHAIARECDKDGGPVDIGVGGSRGPGKSFCVFAQVCLDDCQRIAGLKALFLRQTGKSASESFNDLIMKVLRGKVSYTYNASNNVLHFPNGSRVLLGGFETERDIDKYIGIEYDLQAIEERNQITNDKIIKLQGSLRTSRDDWRPRMYSSFNPGGISHQELKTEFVEPHRDGKETRTRFIPATYKDNPYLNKEYIDYLLGLVGDLGRMWREGDWDIFAGQFFSEYREEIHTIEPFVIPSSWKRFRSIDVGGRNGVTACGWFALDYDGRVLLYREYVETGKDSDEHARKITELSEGEVYQYTVMDSSAFSKIGLPETIAEVYIRNGVGGLVPCSKGRVAGWDFMHQYLRFNADNPPKLQVFKTCKRWIKSIPTLITDEKNPCDLDSSGDDHCADFTQYLLTTLRASHTVKPMTTIERRLRELKEMREKEKEYSLYY